MEDETTPENELMGLYAIVREEANALKDSRARLDKALTRLEALEGALKDKGMVAIAKAEENVSEAVSDAFSASLERAAVPVMRKLDQSVEKARRQLRGVTWLLCAGLLLLGSVVGGSISFFYWNDTQKQIDSIADNLNIVSKAIKDQSKISNPKFIR